MTGSNINGQREKIQEKFPGDQTLVAAELAEVLAWKSTEILNATFA